MTKDRKTILEIDKEEFKKIGHQLVDDVAELIAGMNKRQVTSGETPGKLQKLIGPNPLPENGKPPGVILSQAKELLFNHSLFNGHPKFFGYITSSPTPIGILADLLATAVNPNVGANILSPMATEIEKQTIRWLAEFIGVSSDYGGILVSGGNVANFTGFLAGRTAKAPKNVKADGIAGASKKMTVYCSVTTHTWVEKAATLFGLGSASVRWIGTNQDNRIDNGILEQTINDDIKKGFQPIMVIGTAGDVSTGVVDDLKGIASICKKYDLWFHVDGAYGIPAAVVPECRSMFEGVEDADSIALDPHKWLYSPLEAGCTLVKDPNHLIEAYSSHPVYYNFTNEEEPATLNFYEYGLQNSRGFRALKVWLALQQAGRNGYINLIREDIMLSKLMFDKAKKHPELQALTQHLSISTFRYVPEGYSNSTPDGESYLNRLNETLVNVLQEGGDVFVSNAVVSNKYCLRACIVNFRTSVKDIEEMLEIVVREGRRINSELK